MWKTVFCKYLFRRQNTEFRRQKRKAKGERSNGLVVEWLIGFWLLATGYMSNYFYKR
jgi:hypothetical protein